MEEMIKSRAVLILVILSVIFFLGMVGSCSSAHKLKVSHDKEMALRLDLEERASRSGQEKAVLESKINSITQALDEEKVAHQTTKKVLLQEQLVNQSLREELQKITKLKEALEEDLKEALVSGKSAKSKK
jgi:hypothetical protein